MAIWIPALFIAIWFLLPAYAANAFPPLAKGKIPLDIGKFLGKERIFGDGKTFEGTTLGLVAGLATGFVQETFFPQINTFAMQYGAELPKMTFFLAILITVGALSGDIVESFYKRRKGMKRGQEFLIFDQLDFVIGMIIFMYWFVPLTLEVVFLMLAITPIVHRLACIIGYHLKVKLVPW